MAESRSWRNLIPYVFPALAATALYAPAVANGFVYDDAEIVVSNPLLHSITSFPQLLVTPYWHQRHTLYRPLTLLSLGLDWVLGGGSPALPHLVNVLLHAAVTAMVAVLARRWLSPVAAFAAAMVFAIHPAHAEAVASTVGRAELLCALMLLGITLLATSRRAATGGGRLAMMALAAGALASKEIGVVAPAIAFVAAWARPDQRAHARSWAGAALLGVLPLLAARFVVLGTLGGDVRHAAFDLGSWGSHELLALGMLVRTAGYLVAPVAAPVDLAPTFRDALDPNPLMAAAGLALVALAGAALVRHLRNPSGATLAVGIVALTLAPTANLLFSSGVVLSGRNLYAPSIGIALLAGWALAAPIPRPVVTGALVVWGLIAGVTTAREARVWRDDGSLSGAMLARTPESYRAHAHAAWLSRTRSDPRGAVSHFREAINLFPADAGLLYLAATTALETGDTTDAITWLDDAIILAPERLLPRTRLVTIVLARGDRARAAQLLDAGLRLHPEQRSWADSRRRLGEPASTN